MNNAPAPNEPPDPSESQRKNQLKSQSESQHESNYKSRGGLQRVWRAFTYSAAGLRAAVRHEAAFRQELALGLPLVLLALGLAPGRWQLALMVGSILLVWIVELLNSAIEALADAVSVEHHALLGRAKDLGSAAVMLSLISVVLAWALALWP